MLSISGISPAPGEKNVALDSQIEFTLVDDGTGIDISTLAVEIKGFRAVSQLEFESGFDGSDSSINSDEDNFIINIHPEENFEIGSIIGVKIQVQDLDGSYFNTTYSFKTIPSEPILISSNPDNNGTLTGPQLLSLEFEDTIDGIDINSLTVAINGLDYITDGEIIASVNGLITDITESGNSLVARIDPIEPLKDGDYTLSYQVADPAGNNLVGKIKFTVANPEIALSSVFAQVGFLGYYQGITKVYDIGLGDSLLLNWGTPIKKSYQNDVFVLIYENEDRLSVFDDPKYLALSTIQEAVVNNLTPSKAISYGARALSLPAGIFDPNGMTIIDEEFYLLPEKTTLRSEMSETDLTINVDSTDGYPDAGLLLIGTEVVRYNSINRNNNTFVLPNNGRAVLNTSAGVYIENDDVELFLKCTDENTVISLGTPTYQDGYGDARELNYEGFVVTDYSDNDQTYFEGFDFCGYHDSLPQETLTGKKDCGSYLGGETNGFRGFNLYDELLNREEVLLDQTGDPVILLKRIWNGSTCDCMDPRKMHPKMRSCSTCYGTGFEGGFTQVANLRRSDRRIMVHFDETAEDLPLGEEKHLYQDFEPAGWTLPIPAIRDRDLILRFDLSDDIEFIYEVLNVSREKVIFRKYGRQRLTLKRLDKTDIVYTYPFDLSRI